MSSSVSRTGARSAGESEPSNAGPSFRVRPSISRCTAASGLRAGISFSPSVARRLVQQLRGGDERLTARELEVLAAVARGLSNAAVGRALFITEATVKTHLLRVFTKLGVDDRTRAVTVAIERGILPGA